VSIVVDLLCSFFYWLYYIYMVDTFNVFLFDDISSCSAAQDHLKCNHLLCKYVIQHDIRALGLKELSVKTLLS
jgi:hypothetical protein